MKDYGQQLKVDDKSVENDVFVIDRMYSDNEYLIVDVAGIGMVQIKRQEEEGIVVDIYPIQDEAEPVASTWTTDGELVQDEE